MASRDTALSLFDGPHLRARVYGPGAQRLFVSFDSLSPKRASFSERGPVKFYLEKGWSQLQIQTARNDWYLNDDLEPLRAALAEFVQPYQRVSSMAFSMGAYGALLMSGALRLGHVFLVSPQITPFSGKYPRDRRYARFEKPMWRDLDLTEKDLHPGLQGFVLFDPLVRTKDKEHARAIEDMAPGIRAVAMPMAGHPADKTILQGKLWPQFQDLLTDKKCTAAALKSLHRTGRVVSDTYQEELRKRLLARNGRE
jgi:hypothetical protein